MKNPKMLFAIGAFFILGLAFGIGAKLYKNNQAKKFSFMARDNASTFVRDYAPKKGADDAQVYLVEFFDPECESCRKFHPLVKSIMSEFEGKIQLVLRYAPFHANSVFAIKILEAARKQEKYWETLDILYEHQDVWGGHHDPKPELVWNYLPKAGLNIDQLKKDMEDPKIIENLEQDKKDGELLAVQGTPTFFVNGKPLEQFSYQALRDAVAKEITP
ncbi:MAG TPA: thioredoxin domain-containing protein [Bacteriovoracaceae bacterium]|nr:thioredoxin domain-containing protein [Bacteriovoracaceae bacterium]